MHKFKYNSLVATLCVHRQKWTRINRLIEEGKYNRDRFRMSLHQRDGASDARPHLPAARRLTPVDRIYQEYLAACAACNLPVDSSPGKRSPPPSSGRNPPSWKSTTASDIEFAVVIEGGKPRLKARPEKLMKIALVAIHPCRSPQAVPLACAFLKEGAAG